MWRITLKGVVAHRLRYALTALAVLLGVAFIVGTLVLTDTINATLRRPVSARSTRGPARWSGPAAVQPRRQLRQPARADRRQPGRPPLRQVPGVKAVSLGHRGLRPARRRGTASRSAGSLNGPPTLGVAWTDVVGPQPAAAAARRAPAADELPGGDRQALRRRRALPGRRQGRRPHPAAAGDATPSPASPPGAVRTARSARRITAFDPVTAARVLGQPGKVDSINVEAARGVSQPQLVSRLRAAIHDPKRRGRQRPGRHRGRAAEPSTRRWASSTCSCSCSRSSRCSSGRSSSSTPSRSSSPSGSGELALLRAVGASRAPGDGLGTRRVPGHRGAGLGRGPGRGDRAGRRAQGGARRARLRPAGHRAGGEPADGASSVSAVGIVITLVSAVCARPAGGPDPAGRRHAGRGRRARRLSAWRAVRGAILIAGGAAVLGVGLSGARRKPGRADVGAGAVGDLHRRRDPRAVRRPPGQPRCSVPRSRCAARPASSAQQNAMRNPVAHGRDGRGPDGRRDPRLAHDHRRLVHQGLGRARSSTRRCGPTTSSAAAGRSGGSSGFSPQPRALARPRSPR